MELDVLLEWVVIVPENRAVAKQQTLALLQSTLSLHRQRPLPDPLLAAGLSFQCYTERSKGSGLIGNY